MNDWVTVDEICNGVY